MAAVLALCLAGTVAQAQVLWFPDLPGAPEGWWRGHMGTDAVAAIDIPDRDCHFTWSPHSEKTAWIKMYDACSPVSVPDNRPYLFEHNDRAQAATREGVVTLVTHALQRADLRPKSLHVRSQVSTEHTGRKGGGRATPAAWGDVYFRVPEGPKLSFFFTGELKLQGKAGPYNGVIGLSSVPNTVKGRLPNLHSFSLGGSLGAGRVTKDFVLSPGVYWVNWHVDLDQFAGGPDNNSSVEVIIDACVRGSGPWNLPSQIELDPNGQQTALKGLFGPYNTEAELESAIVAAGPALTDITAQTGYEFGFVILEVGKKYYITPPVKGTLGTPYFKGKKVSEYSEFMERENIGLPQFMKEDFNKSTKMADEPGGCLYVPYQEDIILYGTAHTHPPRNDIMAFISSPNKFSDTDYEGAMEIKKNPANKNYGGIYLYAPDKSILRYKPNPADKCDFMNCDNLHGSKHTSRIQ